MCAVGVVANDLDTVPSERWLKSILGEPPLMPHNCFSNIELEDLHPRLKAPDEPSG